MSVRSEQTILVMTRSPRPRVARYCYSVASALLWLAYKPSPERGFTGLRARASPFYRSCADVRTHLTFRLLTRSISGSRGSPERATRPPSRVVSCIGLYAAERSGPR